MTMIETKPRPFRGQTPRVRAREERYGSTPRTKVLAKITPCPRVSRNENNEKS
jgi:hypothetical protein